MPTGIHQIIDHQMRKWEFEAAARRESPRETMTAPRVVHPCLTVARELGAGGGAIARGIASALARPICDREILEAIVAELEPKGIFARFVRVDHPFHHAMMQPAADALTKELAKLVPQEETVPFFSTVTGQRCSGKDCTAAHWGRGIRQAVRDSGGPGRVAGKEGNIGIPDNDDT
jgi:hypothetical protein